MSSSTGLRFATVDDADYDRLARHRWQLGGGGYASRRTARPTRHTLYMHREVLGLARGDRRDGHHRNHRQLDNRRGNLVACTRSQNLLMRRRPSRMVHRLKTCDRYQVLVAGKYLGLYRSRPEAVEVARAERARLLEGVL